MNFSVQTCLTCESFLDLEGGFCSVCHKQLNLSLQPNDSDFEVKGIPVKTLFQWSPNLNTRLNVLMSAVKYRRENTFFAYWANRFYEHHTYSTLSSIDQDVYFIPAPSTSGGRHAQMFALFLSQVYSATYLDGLSKWSFMDDLPQKNLNRFERQVSSQIESNVKISISDKVVLVDDTVTTGATIHQCWRALEKPANFQVWALAHRRLLA